MPDGRMNTEPPAEDILNRSAEALGLSRFVLRRLDSDDITTIADLVKRSESDLLHIPGCGRSSVARVVDALREVGLTLSATDFRPWPSPRAQRGVADDGVVTVQLSVAHAEQLYRVLRQALKAAGRIKEP
jgi:Bacterial RNA polymerase, alpha chain C terminal domain